VLDEKIVLCFSTETACTRVCIRVYHQPSHQSCL